MAKKKEEKHTGTNEQMDEHVHSILTVLKSIESHLASIAYHQLPSRGKEPSVEKAMAQAFMHEDKTLKDKIEQLWSTLDIYYVFCWIYLFVIYLGQSGRALAHFNRRPDL